MEHSPHTPIHGCIWSRKLSVRLFVLRRAGVDVNASDETFRTGWFIEPVITEILILLVIRTHRTFVKSHVGKLLLASSLLVIILVLLIPYSPLAAPLGLVPLQFNLILVICMISLLYPIAGEVTKKILFRKINY